MPQLEQQICNPMSIQSSASLSLANSRQNNHLSNATYSHSVLVLNYFFPCDHPQTVSSAWISIKHCRTLTFVCWCTSLSFLRSLHSPSSTLIQPNAELFKDPNYISQVPTPNKSPGSECRSTSHGSSCNQSCDYHSCSSEAQCAPLYPFSSVAQRSSLLQLPGLSLLDKPEQKIIITITCLDLQK
jgi:hypothetical protein